MNIDDEDELIQSVERGEWVEAESQQQHIDEAKRIAAATLKKTRLSLSLNHQDLQKIKAQALEQGIPYQVLASSILHKYITGKFLEKNA